MTREAGKPDGRLFGTRRSLLTINDCSELAILGVEIAVVGHHLALGDESKRAIGFLLDTERIPILHRVLVGTELETASRGRKVGLEHRRAEGFGVVDLAACGLERCADRESRIIA